MDEFGTVWTVTRCEPPPDIGEGKNVNDEGWLVWNGERWTDAERDPDAYLLMLCAKAVWAPPSDRVRWS